MNTDIRSLQLLERDLEAVAARERDRLASLERAHGDGGPGGPRRLPRRGRGGSAAALGRRSRRRWSRCSCSPAASASCRRAARATTPETRRRGHASRRGRSRYRDPPRRRAVSRGTAAQEAFMRTPQERHTTRRRTRTRAHAGGEPVPGTGGFASKPSGRRRGAGGAGRPHEDHPRRAHRHRDRRRFLLEGRLARHADRAVATAGSCSSRARATSDPAR